jgi:hypothetical protein
MKGFVAFDVETAELVPEGAGFAESMPHMACAITSKWDAASGYEHIRWYEGMERGGTPESFMGSAVCKSLVDYLSDCLRNGYSTVTFNGTAFDMRILARWSGMLDEVKALTLAHVDMWYAMLCQRGFACGLSKIGAVYDLGKFEGVSGKDVPNLWHTDPVDTNRARILDYVQGDGELTGGVFINILRSGEMKWKSDDGAIKEVFSAKTRVRCVQPCKDAGWPFPNRFLTVQELMAWPAPDTGWMKSTPTFTPAKTTEWLFAPAWWKDTPPWEEEHPLLGAAVKMGATVSVVKETKAGLTGYDALPDSFAPEEGSKVWPADDIGFPMEPMPRNAASCSKVAVIQMTNVLGDVGLALLPDGSFSDLDYVIVRRGDGTYGIALLSQYAAPEMVPLDYFSGRNNGEMNEADLVKWIRENDPELARAMNGILMPAAGGHVKQKLLSEDDL